MSALTDARARLAEIVTEALAGLDVQVFSVIPGKVTPPFVAVGPGAPYIEYDAGTFGYRRVRLFATAVAAAGSNDIEAAQLDDLLIAIAEAVDASGDFIAVSVDQPGQIAINGQTHLGASVQCLTEVAFG